MENEILSEIRLLKIYAAALTLGLAVLCLTAFTPSSHKQKFEEIDAERINIVDAHGIRQLIISNKDRFHDPILNGQELKRSVRPSGLAFYDANGNEAGGLATSQTASGKISLLAFDYATAEAMDLGVESDGTKYAACFQISDPPTAGTKLEEAPSKQQTRTAIRNRDKDAQITLADANGKVVFTAPK